MEFSSAKATSHQALIPMPVISSFLVLPLISTLQLVQSYTTRPGLITYRRDSIPEYDPSAANRSSNTQNATLSRNGSGCTSTKFLMSTNHRESDPPAFQPCDSINQINEHCQLSSDYTSLCTSQYLSHGLSFFLSLVSDRA